MTRVPASACGSRQNRGSRRRPKRGSHRSLQNARAGFAFRTGFHRPSSSPRRCEPSVERLTPDRRTAMTDRFLREREVRSMTGLSRTTRWRLERVSPQASNLARRRRVVGVRSLGPGQGSLPGQTVMRFSLKPERDCPGRSAPERVSTRCDAITCECENPLHFIHLQGEPA